MDMVPGIITYYWITPTRTGDFEVLCAEYCGSGHYAMRGVVKVDEKKDYSNWLAQQISYEKMLAKNNEPELLLSEDSELINELDDISNSELTKSDILNENLNLEDFCNSTKIVYTKKNKLK